MNRVFFSLFMTLATFSLSTQQEPMGYWKTINKKEGFTTGIHGFYLYNNKLYGQTLISFDENTGVLLGSYYYPELTIKCSGEKQYMCRTAFIWDLVEKNNLYEKGKIMDTRNGMIYDCRLWIEEGKLIVEGGWGIFKGKEIFYPIQEGEIPIGVSVPSLLGLVPSVPR